MGNTIKSGTGEFTDNAIKITNRFNSTKNSRIDSAKRKLPFNVDNIPKHTLQTRMSNLSASPKNGESPLK